MLLKSCIKKVFLFVTPIFCAALITPFLSSCGIFDGINYASYLQQAMHKSSQIKWISNRSMSLKFISTSNTVGYGTGWILGKNKNAIDTYYIATNMHVASFIANMGENYYQQYGSGFVPKTGKVYSSVEIGLVGDMLGGKFYQGTNEPLRRTNDGGIHFVTSLPIAKTKVVYSANKAFEQNRYVDPYNVRGKYINNATIDFAIIEMDFSKTSRLPINGYADDIVTNFLRYYDQNPTVFAKENGEKFLDNLHIAGFPYDNPYFNGNNVLQSKKESIWVGLSHLKIDKLISSLSLKINKPQDTIYDDQALNNEINFIDKPYVSYRNVAIQGLMKGIDIGGGSSGSMVVNDNNEVIGIYWGVYNMKIAGENMNMGGIDFFNTNMYFIPIDGKNYTSWDYNILKSIQGVLGQNLETPVWS